MYDTPNPRHEARRDKRRASGFQPDPEMERLLRLKADNPDRFERIVGSSKLIELGYYQSARAAHERTGGDAA